MSTRKNKTTWVIVLFSISKDYSVVPINWLVQDCTFNLSNCNIEYCYWPVGNVTSIEISEAKNPEQSWCTYKIKVLGGNKTYDNFKRAWHTRVAKESESEEFQPLSKRKQTLFDSTDSSSEDGFSVLPLHVKKKKHKVYADLQTVETTSSQAQQSIINQPAIHQSTSTYQPYDNLTIVHQPPMIPDVQSENNSVQQSMESGILSNYIGFETLDIKLKSIMQEQISTNLMLNRINAKIQLMEENSKNKGQKNNDTSIRTDSQFLSYFPLQNAEELLLLENRIKNEFEFVPKLESFIKNIGGNDAKHHVKRVMNKIFTDEHCVKISWTGRGWATDMTKLKETTLIQIIQKVIQESSSTVFTDSQFEKTVTERLRTANTRFKSYKKKDNPTIH